MSLPIYADNQPIASGLKPEKGPLQLYNWIQYINQDVVNAFEKKYGVQVQIRRSPRSTRRSRRSQSGAVQFDVFVPELVYLERLAVGKVLAPLNLDYIPNLERNVWPTLVNPWYDFGSRYTVPYTIYTTGIGWRTDKLPGFNPAKLANPWSALWAQGPKIAGKVGTARRSARGSDDGAAAQRRHRRQHRRRRAHHRRPEGAVSSWSPPPT